MLILISDANVLIDLEVGGIIDRIFRLKATIAVPDALFDKELAHQHAHLITLGLQLRQLDEVALRRVMAWSGRYPHPSGYDLMAFALAAQLDATLLTGDGRLRKAVEAEREQSGGIAIAVHGTFWLIDQMMDHGVMTDAEAISSVERMKQGKRRLPWDLFEELMRRRTRRTPGSA